MIQLTYQARRDMDHTNLTEICWCRVNRVRQLRLTNHLQGQASRIRMTLVQVAMILQVASLRL